jgi:hypothetical protein
LQQRQHVGRTEKARKEQREDGEQDYENGEDNRLLRHALFSHAFYSSPESQLRFCQEVFQPGALCALRWKRLGGRNGNIRDLRQEAIKGIESM